MNAPRDNSWDSSSEISISVASGTVWFAALKCGRVGSPVKPPAYAPEASSAWPCWAMLRAIAAATIQPPRPHR